MTLIELRNVDLQFEVLHERTNNFKEAAINFLTRRQRAIRKNEAFMALKSIQLKVSEGERVGVIGLNGAGKSTLLKVISGIYRPTRGERIVNGTIQPLIELGAGFDPEFSGRENIFLNGYMLGFSKKQIEGKVEQIIEFSGLREFIDVPLKYYSSGMSVRLAFTIATSIEPEILLVDEMLSAGDINFVEKAKTRLSELVNKAKCLIVVSHDLGTIQQLCQRVIVMQAGDFVFEGPAEEAIAYYKELASRQ